MDLMADPLVDRMEWCSEGLMADQMVDRMEWCSEGPMVDPLAALKVVRKVVQALENELVPVSKGLLVALLEQMRRG